VLTGHADAVWGVAVSADGRTAVSGGDRTVRVWDLAGYREQARWIADEAVLAVAFNAAVTVAGDSTCSSICLRTSFRQLRKAAHRKVMGSWALTVRRF